MRQAVEKVGNADILINIISRRLRQLTAGGGGLGRPLIADAEGLRPEEIAIREVLEDKITWEANTEADDEDLNADSL